MFLVDLLHQEHLIIKFMESDRIYFDYNASSLIRKEAYNSFERINKSYGNPSSIHEEGRSMRNLIEISRAHIANSLNTNEKNIIFTSGGTEAIDIALNQNPGRIIINATEHIAVFESAKKTEAIIEVLEVNDNGIVNLDKLDLMLQKGPALVCVMFANNETGIIQPIKKISEIVRKNNSYLFCDAVQAYGKLKINFDELDIDFMALSAHKVGGFPGSGALIIKENIKKIVPILLGGGQEFGLRGGTENLIGITAFGECAKLIDEICSENLKLKEYINILEKNIESFGGFIFGGNSLRLPNTSLFAFPNIQADTMLIKLDLAGYSVSSGSACSSGKVKKSHVLEAMNVDDKISSNAIRISLGWGTKKSHIDNLLNFFEDIFNKNSIGVKSVR
jgi:cysteine desulfurase